MEAFGGLFDVEATRIDGKLVAFEVKSIGHDEQLFDLEVEALKNDGVFCDAIDLYGPLNYLIFRVYEAARQLAKQETASTSKIDIMILDDYEMNYMFPLNEDWVNWSNPKFLEVEGGAASFLKEKRSQNPILDQDINKYVSNLDEIWFFKMASEFNLQLMKTVHIKED